MLTLSNPDSDSLRQKWLDSKTKKSEMREMFARVIKEWDESEHPRGAGGRFGSGDGSGKTDNGPTDSQKVPTVTGPDGVVSINLGVAKDLEAGAKTYSERIGIDRPNVDFGKVFVNTDTAQHIADNYGRLPIDDPAAHAAYGALAKEVEQQYEFMTKELGIKVDVLKSDPYKDVTEMRKDVEENHHIAVLATAETGHHPFLTDQQNDQFRAVHDVFGHAATGRGFDRHGEEAAWVSHSMMFSPLARQAMTTETRGQNSVLTQEQQGFPPQKVAVLAAEYTDPSALIEAIKKMLMELLEMMTSKAIVSDERNCTAGPAQWDYKNKLGRWASNVAKYNPDQPRAANGEFGSGDGETKTPKEGESRRIISSTEPFDKITQDALSRGGKPIPSEEDSRAGALYLQTAADIANKMQSSTLDLINERHRYPVGDSPEEQKTERERNVSTLMREWQNASNDSSETSLSMQKAAAEEFGIKNYSGWSDCKDYVLTGTEKRFSDHGEVYKDFLRTQYDATQAEFAKQGFNPNDTFLLYRGVDLALPNVGEKFDAQLRPLSSYSTDPLVARKFADSNESCFATEVQVKDILSTPATGIGCLNEREMVVLGGVKESTVVSIKLDIGQMNELGTQSYTVQGLPDSTNATKAAKKTINVDNNLINSDWIKTGSWGFPEITDLASYASVNGINLKATQVLSAQLKSSVSLPSWIPAPQKLKDEAKAYLEQAAKSFNPDQPRDSHGRFGSGNGVEDWQRTLNATADLKSSKEDRKRYFEIVGQANKEAQKKFESSFRMTTPLTSSEEDALRAYTLQAHITGSAESINLALRNDLGDKASNGVKQGIEQIDKAMARSITTEPMTTFRGVKFDLGLGVGETFTDKGYVATSLTDHIAEVFAGNTERSMIEIKIPEGSNALPNNRDKEAEVILPRGSTFVVDDIQKNYDKFGRETLYKMSLVNTAKGIMVKGLVEKENGETGGRFAWSPSDIEITEKTAKSLAKDWDESAHPRGADGRFGGGGGGETLGGNKIDVQNTKIFGDNLEGLDEKAFRDYLQKNGTSMEGQKCPEFYGKGEPNRCFDNATDLVLDSQLDAEPLRYCEGLVEFKSEPGNSVLHAWAVDAGGNVIDNTLGMKAENCIYNGVTYDNEKYAWHCLASGTSGVIGGVFASRVLERGGL